MPRTTTAYAASLVVSTNAAVLNGLTGFNSKTSDQFILLFDASSLPADGAVPVTFLVAPASQHFSIDFGYHGREFTTGLVICNSSTGPTKTIGSNDCWFDARVRSKL